MLLGSTGNASDVHGQTAAFRGRNQRATDGAATDDSNSFHETLHNLGIKDLDARALLNADPAIPTDILATH
jgi:hypothetical protein